MTGRRDAAEDVPEPPPVPQATCRRYGDQRVVRRALLAGAATWTAAVLALAALGAGTSGRAVGVAVLLGLVFAALVTAGWLLLAAALDLLAGVPLGRRRIVWTVAAILVASLSPLLFLGSLAGRP